MAQCEPLLAGLENSDYKTALLKVQDLLKQNNELSAKVVALQSGDADADFRPKGDALLRQLNSNLSEVFITLQSHFNYNCMINY